MKVIKLGGSLLRDKSSLRQCLKTVDSCSESVVIVPGGGVFADQVRASQKQWGFDQVTAHQMALLAMQQMALLFKGIKPSLVVAEAVKSIQALNKDVVVWSPNIAELDSAGIKASWDITSDSLAAWLAHQLAATELIIVKSAKVPLHLSIQQMQEQGLVDNAFVAFTKDAGYHITLINKDGFNEHTST